MQGAKEPSMVRRARPANLAKTLHGKDGGCLIALLNEDTNLTTQGRPGFGRRASRLGSFAIDGDRLLLIAPFFKSLRSRHQLRNRPCGVSFASPS
jgi:hypothetical protein